MTGRHVAADCCGVESLAEILTTHPLRKDPNMTDPTPQQILDLPLPANDAEAATIRDYLRTLLSTLWFEADGFSGKRPFGNSDWQYDLYEPMVEAGLVPGAFCEYDGEDLELRNFDRQVADRLVQQAIATLGTESGNG